MNNTKKNLFIILFGLIINLSAQIMPFSQNNITTEAIEINNLLRVVPADSMICPLSNSVYIWHTKQELCFDINAEINDDFYPGKLCSEDEWPESDFFRIQVITDLKNYYSYVFYVFPLGSKYDGIRNSDFEIDKNWDSSYSYLSNITSDKWETRLKIPFKDLRFFGNPPYNWKIIITRFMKKSREYFSFPFVRTKMGKDYYRLAKNIQIVDRITKSSLIFLRPYTIVNYNTIKNEFVFDDESFGLDFSIKPTFSTNFKLSYNPDFSDIPIDDETDIYNLRYSPTLEENRFFFTEDLNAFGINNTTFYTRHILQPLYAMKFTGNTHNFTFGFLSIKDKKTSYNQDDFFNVLAFNPSFKNFNVQITLLNRMNKDYYNNVLHIKPSIDLSYNKILWLDLNLSTKTIDDEDLLSGYHGKFGLDIFEDNLNLSMTIQQMSNDYAMDMGKIYEDNYYGWNISSSYKKDIFANPLRSIELLISASEEIDNDTSLLLERMCNITTNFETIYDVSITPDLFYVKEFFADKHYEKYRAGLRMSWDYLQYFQPKSSWNILETLIYSLEDMYISYYYQYGLSGDLGKYISYFFSADNIIYEEVPANPSIDDEYWIFNGDININFTNSLSISSGVGFNNYDYYEYSDHWGIYSNLIWEYKSQSTILLGYKSARDKINSELETDYEKLYLKINYSF